MPEAAVAGQVADVLARVTLPLVRAPSQGNQPLGDNGERGVSLLPSA